MAPTSKKRGAPASASKSLVRRKKVKTYDGRPTRAEKSVENKKRYAAEQAAGKRESRVVLEKLRSEVLSPKSAIGRPGFPWSDKLGERLFELISTGHGMDNISQMEGMPGLGTMVRWLGSEEHPFKKIYARAKQLLLELYEERAQLAAVNPEPFVIVTERQVLNRDGDIVDVVERKIVDNVQRSALKLEGYRWTLGYLNPKKHGRTPDPGASQPNEQLEGLFAALKAGPAE